MKYQGNIDFWRKYTLDAVTLNDTRLLKFIEVFSTYYPKNLKQYKEILNKYQHIFDFFDDKNNVFEIRKHYFEILENQIIKIRDKGIGVSGSLYKDDDFKIEGCYELIVGDVFDYENDFLNEYLKTYNNTVVEVAPLERIIKTLEKRGKNFEHIRDLEVRLSKLEKGNKSIFKTLKCKKIANEIMELKTNVARDYEYIFDFKIGELELLNNLFNSIREYDKFEVDYRNCNPTQKQSELNYAYDRIMIYCIKEMIDSNKTTLDEVEYVFYKYSFKTSPGFIKRYHTLIDENIIECVKWICQRQYTLRIIKDLVRGIREPDEPYFKDVDVDRYSKMKLKRR